MVSGKIFTEKAREQGCLVRKEAGWAVQCEASRRQGLKPIPL